MVYCASLTQYLLGKNWILTQRFWGNSKRGFLFCKNGSHKKICSRFVTHAQGGDITARRQFEIAKNSFFFWQPALESLCKLLGGDKNLWKKDLLLRSPKRRSGSIRCANDTVTRAERLFIIYL